MADEPKNQQTTEDQPSGQKNQNADRQNGTTPDANNPNRDNAQNQSEK